MSHFRWHDVSFAMVSAAAIDNEANFSKSLLLLLLCKITERITLMNR